MSYFPYGRAAFSIFLLAIISGIWVVAHPVQEHKATLVYWTFASDHLASYQQIVPEFESVHPGVTVDLQLVSLNALAARLQSAMLANLDVPDMFEIEIGSAGQFFRGPKKDIGLLDLTSRVHAPGPDGAPSLWDRVVRARLAPYTDRGSIYGLPHDVHPIQIAYRRDIFAKYGIDPSKIKTWAQFIAIGHKLTIPGKQYMIELSDSDATNLETLLFQRGGGYFDANGNVIFDNNIGVQTLCWYIPLVAGPHKIADNVGLFNSVEYKAIADGYMLSYICPDWRSQMFQQYVPQLSGKMALMPLPMVAPGTRPTSTWGGTMVGITKHCKHPNLAWQLAMFFYLNKKQVAPKFLATNIIPPIKDEWTMPVFKQKNPYWSNQPLGETYIRLAPSVPARYNSPVLSTASDKLGQALIDSIRYYDTHGYPASDNPQFVAFVRARLKESADQVRALIRRDPYE